MSEFLNPFLGEDADDDDYELPSFQDLSSALLSPAVYTKIDERDFSLTDELVNNDGFLEESANSIESEIDWIEESPISDQTEVEDDFKKLLDDFGIEDINDESNNDLSQISEIEFEDEDDWDEVFDEIEEQEPSYREPLPNDDFDEEFNSFIEDDFVPPENSFGNAFELEDDNLEEAEDESIEDEIEIEAEEPKAKKKSLKDKLLAKINEAKAELKGDSVDSTDDDEVEDKEDPIEEDDEEDAKEDKPKKKKSNKSLIKKIFKIIFFPITFTISFIVKILLFILGILSKLPLIGGIFAALAKQQLILTIIAAALPVLGGLFAVYSQGSNPLATSHTLNFPDGGQVVITDFNYDSENHDFTAIIKNTGEVNATVSGYLEIHSIQKSINPISLVMPKNNNPKCQIETLTLNIAESQEIKTKCEYKGEPKKITGKLSWEES